MSFPVMIHLKSTLAVTVIMLAGLVAASPFPYPSEHESAKPRAAAAAVEPAAAPVATTAWIDPPAQPQAVVARPIVEANSGSETPAPQFVALPPAPDTTASAMKSSARTATRQASAQARAEQTRRRKMAREAARERQATLRQTVPNDTAAHETPAASQRIDPIGDILRGLGIGKEG